MKYVIQVPEQLSQHLRALRKAKGLSQVELAARLGLSQTRVARIEKDPLSISVSQLLRVLSVLGMKVALEDMPDLGASANVALPPLPLRSGEGEATPKTNDQKLKSDEDW